MENSLGSSVGADRTFPTPPAIDNSKPAASKRHQPQRRTERLVHADHLEVHYYFEWGPTTAYGTKTPALPEHGCARKRSRRRAARPPGKHPGRRHLPLPAGRHQLGGNHKGQDRTFKTAEPPQISNLGGKNVKAESADLTAEVNPNRGETEWFFEWGPTTGYGNKIPIPAGSIPASSDPSPVEAHLEGLSVGQTYHFRLVATNEFGTRDRVTSPSASTRRNARTRSPGRKPTPRTFPTAAATSWSRRRTPTGPRSSPSTLRAAVSRPTRRASSTGPATENFPKPEKR